MIVLHQLCFFWLVTPCAASRAASIQQRIFEGSSSFFSHDISLLPCMACCRGNRPKTALAAPALPGESTHADMRLASTCCMTRSGIFFSKCQWSQQPPDAAISGHDHITDTLRHRGMCLTHRALGEIAALKCSAENLTCWFRLKYNCPCLLIQSLFHLKVERVPAFLQQRVQVCVHIHAHVSLHDSEHAHKADHHTWYLVAFYSDVFDYTLWWPIFPHYGLDASINFICILAIAKNLFLSALFSLLLLHRSLLSVSLSDW